MIKSPGIFACALLCAALTLLTSPAQAIDIIWDTTVFDDYYEPSHWAPAQIPTFNDDAFILNEDAAHATDGLDINANNFYLGDPSQGSNRGVLFSLRTDIDVNDNFLIGAHRLDQQTSTNPTFSSGQFEHTIGNFYVGRTPGDFDRNLLAGVASTHSNIQTEVHGNVRFSNNPEVDITNHAIFGFATGIGGRIDAGAAATVHRVENFNVGGNLNFASLDAQPSQSDVFAHASANGNFTEIDNINIGGHLTVANANLVADADNPNDVRSSARTDVFFERGGIINVGGNVDVAVISINKTFDARLVDHRPDPFLTFHVYEAVTINHDFNIGVIQGNAEVSSFGNLIHFIDMIVPSSTRFVQKMQVNGHFNVGVINLNHTNSDPQPHSTYQANPIHWVENSTFNVAGKTSVGIIKGSANVTGARLNAKLHLINSVLNTTRIDVGRNISDNNNGMLEGRLELTRSIVNTEHLHLGDDGLILFDLSGLDRVTDPTVGDPIYAAINASDAILESGRIISDFNFLPPAPGTYSFDLIITDSSTALDDTAADISLEIIDLPPDFCVIFYGVAHEDNDILRLTISTDCDDPPDPPDPTIPEPTTLTLLTLLATSLTRRCYH